MTTNFPVKDIPTLLTGSLLFVGHSAQIKLDGRVYVGDLLMINRDPVPMEEEIKSITFSFLWLAEKVFVPVASLVNGKENVDLVFPVQHAVVTLGKGGQFGSKTTSVKINFGNNNLVVLYRYDLPPSRDKVEWEVPASPQLVQ